MKTETILYALAALAVAMVAGCNSYNPNLGDRPYRCGTTEPICPEGYECRMYSETERYCERRGSTLPPPPDAMPEIPDALVFRCANDNEIEPNETVIEPTPTRVPELADEHSIAGLAICPTNDVDVFRFRSDVFGTSVQADITFDPSRGGLLLNVLNPTGITIAQGTAVDGDPGHVRAQVTSLAEGPYFIQVRATPGVENNYDLVLMTAPPAPPSDAGPRADAAPPVPPADAAPTADAAPPAPPADAGP